ncbi:dephospho-CoA kinase [Lottiidibacillus patelloidae]|uniref:Dephospho-CoA kinase n=1 Tax=Lottiidibacillus patelloidae TaxID=2670334 RepID=A0A263BWJ6_9BACI|nr:dephospho-CoA kinase [Lottiidibacillus patelloidae]OZM57942.1 dephospho-CoA kinase [Lottiidibacillus patelloidae]
MAQIIGITGGIASGKSTVTGMLRNRGYAIIDADIVAREVVEPGEEAYNLIVNHFGRKIIGENSFLDRQLLGEIIFNDQKEREVLNSIVHPAVRLRMNDKKDMYISEGRNTVIFDIPLLFESKLQYLVEKTILVYVNAETQLQRLMKRNEFSEQEAVARIRSQMPLDDKRPLADIIINNNGTVGETEEQLEKIIINWNLSV